jgi:hypothetical protein
MLMRECTFLCIFDLRILGAAIWTIIPAARTKKRRVFKELSSISCQLNMKNGI